MILTELDKANARIAQLEEALKNISDMDGTWDEYKAIADEALTSSSDTWLSQHDKAVEVKVLEDVRQQNADTYLDIMYAVDDMIESRK